MTNKQLEEIAHLVSYHIISKEQALKIIDTEIKREEFKIYLKQLIEEQNE